MRDEFANDDGVKKINAKLAKQKGVISDKPLSVALDTTSKTTWETSIVPHLADIPLSLVGTGEQNCVKIKLAIDAEDTCEVLLIEEPENHLTHSNLNKLIKHMAENSGGHQLILTTHSSFVLNKLGVDHVHMFTPVKSITLDNLDPSTKDYSTLASPSWPYPMCRAVAQSMQHPPAEKAHSRQQTRGIPGRTSTRAESRTLGRTSW